MKANASNNRGGGMLVLPEFRVLSPLRLLLRGSPRKKATRVAHQMERACRRFAVMGDEHDNGKKKAPAAVHGQHVEIDRNPAQEG